MPAVVCDRVRVSVVPLVLEGKTVQMAQSQVFEVPAYSVSQTDLTDKLFHVWESYCDKSEKDGAPYSLGDFAMYCLVMASQEPMFQEL